MQKYVLLCCFLFVSLFSTAQPNTVKDSAIQLASVKMNVTSNNYSATTFVELELFNPNPKVMDGEINFSLAEGQVINDFKLDINGRMRDGVSIEKQQARVAYENIVRRKVDPGLLELVSPNQYRIRVYPMPANGRRYVSFTVQQLLTTGRAKLDYIFPVQFSNPVKRLAVTISVATEEMPFTTTGLLQDLTFSREKELRFETQAPPANSLLAFSIPVNGQVSVCLFEDAHCANAFVARIIPDDMPVSRKAPTSVTVFWDVSASAAKRDLPKEILFLKDYLKTLAPQRLTIVTFALDVMRVEHFNAPAQKFSAIKRFLEAQKADGGTRLNRLYCEQFPADEYLLFSDGQPTFGDGSLHVNGKPVFPVQSSLSANNILLNTLAKTTGAKLIDLAIQTKEQAISSLQQAQWKLVLNDEHRDVFGLEAIEAGSGFLVRGSNKESRDSLVLQLVYAGQSRDVVLHLKDPACINEQIVEAAAVLNWRSALGKIGNADSLHAIATAQKLVTSTSSLIVLDAIEDYYQYQVTPPNELLEEFRKRYPSMPGKKEERQKEQEILVYRKLQQSVDEYNEKIQWWDRSLAKLHLERFVERSKPVILENDKGIADANSSSDKVIVRGMNSFSRSKSNALSEVVVVASGISRRRSEMGYSTSVSGDQLATNPASTVRQALQGRVAGLNIINGQPGASSEIRLRGAASIRGGGEPLYILDGARVSAETVMEMSIQDIENISVLKDAAETAVYGNAGNGVIVITTKKGKADPYARFAEEDEIGEIVDSLRQMPGLQQYDRYLEIRERMKDEPDFYFQMAEFFFHQDQPKEALRIISNLAEINQENHQLLRMMGYVLEEWNDYANAIEIYKTILRIKEEEPQSYRDLALAYARKGDRKAAIDLFYKALTKDWGMYEMRYEGLREIIMTELNTLAGAGNMDSVFLSKSLLQPLPVDLRIVIDWNKDETDIDLHVVEPGGEVCSYSNENTRNGGRISDDFTEGYGPEVYEIKEAKKGTYKIGVNYYGDRYQKQQVPSFIKLTVFKYYGKPNQAVFVKTIKMENKDGMVDLADVRF